MNKRYFLISRWFIENDAPTNYSILCFEDKDNTWIAEYLKTNYSKYEYEELYVQII